MKVIDMIKNSPYKYLMNKNESCNKAFLNLCITWNSENWTTEDFNSNYKNKTDYIDFKDLTIQEIINANVDLEQDYPKQSKNKQVVSILKKKKYG